jgi:hypothetical protein
MGYASVRFKSRAPFTDPRAFFARGWRAEPAFSYVVPLTDVKHQWERVEQNLRRLVERCAEQGGAFGEDADFDGFFRLHAATSDRKRAPIYLPHGAFRQYFEKLRARGLCKLFHVRWTDGRPIAAQLVLLGNHRVTHTVSAAADVEYLKTGANAYLRWKTFEALAALGYHGNDLTDASLNPVTHFKSQLGGDLTTAWVLQSPESFAFKAGRAVQRLRSRVG